MTQLHSSKIQLAFIFAAFLFITPAKVFSQSGELDQTFNGQDRGITDSSNGANNDVRSISIQTDGKIIIGGLFTTYNEIAAGYITRINAEGSKDVTFNPGGAGADGPVAKNLLQADGKILVAGAFTSYNGVAANALIRLNSDGSRDATFNVSALPNGAIRALAIQTNGKLIVGGAFSNFNGAPANFIVRLNADGTTDGTFNSAGSEVNSSVNAVAIQTTGKIVVGMNNDGNGVITDFISRLNSDGTTDGTFNSGGAGADGSVHAITLQADGKILAGGMFASYNNVAASLVRLTTAGALDNSFTLNPPSFYDGGVKVITLQADQKIFIGWGQQPSNSLDAAGRKIHRLNSNGTVDATFNYFLHDILIQNIYAIAVQADGKVLVGETLKSKSYPRSYLIGGVVLGSTKNIRINRYTSTGLIDAQFAVNPSSTGAKSTVLASVALPDGKVLIAGSFLVYNGEPVNYLARLNGDGSRDASFNAGGSGPNAQVNSIAVQTDGKIILAGVFSAFNGIPAQFVVRLNANGSVDAGFNASGAGYSSFDSNVFSVSLQADGKILLLTSVDKVLVRLNTDGSRDMSFNPSFPRTNLVGAFLYALAIQPDGKILAGGEFDRVPVIPQTVYIKAKNIVRLNIDGTLDTTFNHANSSAIPQGSPILIGATGAVQTIAVQTDGKILIGGDFSGYNTTDSFNYVNRIARLKADGTVDLSFNAGGTGPNGSITKITLQADGRILVAGEFTSFNGNTKNKLVRLNADGSLDNSFNINGNEINAGSTNLIALLPDGRKFYLAGTLRFYNNVAKNRIIRVYNCDVTRSTTNIAICTSQLPYSWNGASYNAAGTYNKVLRAASGCDSIATLVLTLNSTAISGPVKSCAYTGASGAEAIYTVNAPAGSTYNWTVNRPLTMLILSGQGTNSVHVKFTDDFIGGNIYVTVKNVACNINVTSSLGIRNTPPSTPGAITTDATTICQYINSANSIRYSIRKVTGATSYNWDAQAGTTSISHINGSGANDTTVTVTFAAGFSISSLTVQAVNDCGTSAARSLVINPSAPSTPGAITGSATACGHIFPYGYVSTYSVPFVEAVSYEWTLPAGATDVTGLGTNTVSFLFPANYTTGIVSVKAVNGCGMSSSRSITVKQVLPSTPAAITPTSTSPCPDRVFTYSIPSLPANANGVQWKVPAGATLLTADNILTVSVSYPSGATSDYVTVEAYNQCEAHSPLRKLFVNLPACASPLLFTRGSNSSGRTSSMPAVAISEGMQVNVFPNPSAGAFNAQVVSAAKEAISVRILDVTGRAMSSKILPAFQMANLGADLKAGTYIFEVRQGNETKTSRVIKL